MAARFPRCGVCRERHRPGRLAARLALGIICAPIAALAIDPSHAQAASLAEIQRRAATAQPGAFGSTRFPVASAQAFPQWERVWRQTRAESERLAICLSAPGSHPDCTRGDWRRWANIVSQARKLDGLARLRAVNDFFNDWPYREDDANYGQREAWVSPATFMRQSGDCEDYAIAKYATLRLAGVPDERMWIVVVRDEIRQIRHAVLVVETPEEISVLDSLSPGIFADSLFGHYEAEYSVNAVGQWTHGRSMVGRR
jgi:predicted transglutaminase-like cysteine proteinase